VTLLVVGEVIPASIILSFLLNEKGPGHLNAPSPLIVLVDDLSKNPQFPQRMEFLAHNHVVEDFDLQQLAGTN
jgi:hypothetical protein